MLFYRAALPLSRKTLNTPIEYSSGTGSRGHGSFRCRRIVSGRIAEIYRSARLGAAVGSIGELRAPEISTLDVGAIKPGIVHLGVFSAGPLQVGVAWIAVQEVGVVPVSVLKMATVSVDVEEISV